MYHPSFDVESQYPFGSQQGQNFEHGPTQAQLPGSSRAPPAARPQRQKRSTQDAMEQLSELISRPANRGGARGRGGGRGGGRGHAQPSRGKKGSVNNIPRPARNSGLNPSGNPLDSQLGRASEFLHLSASTSDSTDSLLDTGVSAFGALQGVEDVNDVHAYGILSHQHEEPSFSTENFTYDADFQQLSPILAQQSTVNTNQDEPTLPWDDPTPSLPHAGAENYFNVPEQPLRLGEVTRGSMVPASQPAFLPPPSHERAGVIRGSGPVMDVLANRHARRAPYKLPSISVSSMSTDTSATSTSNGPEDDPSDQGFLAQPTRMRVRRWKTDPMPVDIAMVIANAKEYFRLTLLTSNAMPSSTVHRAQAADQVISSCHMLGLTLQVGQIDKKVFGSWVKKVSSDGSSMRNEFKSAAREIVISGIYNFTPRRDFRTDAQEHVSRIVGALLDTRTGAWMNNGKDMNGIVNYFEHPAIEEAINRTIFSRPSSIGNRFPNRFENIPAPLLALVCCALFCALEEWESGSYAPIEFLVDKYRDMYESLTQVNIRCVLEDEYLRKKLDAMWARVRGQGCRLVGRRPNMRRLHNFVKPVGTLPDVRLDVGSSNCCRELYDDDNLL